MKARMASMRAAEVQARVGLRVAERKLETAELEGEAERQGETLDALRRQEAELQDQRRQAEAAAARVEQQLGALQRGVDGAAERTERMRAYLHAAEAEHALSEAGVARRAKLLEEQSARQRAMGLERERLLTRQAQLGGGIDDCSNGALGGYGTAAGVARRGSGGDVAASGSTPLPPWTVRLQEQQRRDERRIAELERGLGLGPTSPPAYDDAEPLKLPPPASPHSHSRRRRVRACASLRCRRPSCRRWRRRGRRLRNRSALSPKPLWATRLRYSTTCKRSRRNTRRPAGRTRICSR